MGAELPGNPLGWLIWITGGYVEGADIDFHPGAEDSAFEEPPIPNARWGFATQLMKYFFYGDPDWTYEGYDFSDYDHHVARLSPTLDADNPDLSQFRSHGGKLIIDNGWMDGSLSAYGTIDYYESVLKHDPTARNDVRLFVRPGVTHCSGGPGPDGTDYIAALEQWLDTSTAPDQLDAPFVHPVTREPSGGGRIICAHPAVVTYDGNGNPSEPESFSCKVPRQ
jgi:feruloyl esterase